VQSARANQSMNMPSRTSVRKLCWLTAFVVIGLNFVYFLHRMFNSDYCNIELLMKEGLKGAAGQLTDRATNSCLRATDASSAAGGGGGATTTPWCVYADEVDLRIIVLTFNRHESLLRLLRFTVKIYFNCRFVSSLSI